MYLLFSKFGAAIASTIIFPSLVLTLSRPDCSNIDSGVPEGTKTSAILAPAKLIELSTWEIKAERKVAACSFVLRWVTL